MPVADITPLVVDPSPASRVAVRPGAVVSPTTPSTSTQSASTALSVDESSTEAEAGAALSAFLVQMGSGATATTVRSASEADNPPNDTEGFERTQAEALQVSMPNSSASPPGDVAISLFADPHALAAPRDANVATGAASDPIFSAIAAEQTSPGSSQPAVSAEVDNALNVIDSSTSANAAAALSTFLVQSRIGSSDAPPSSALESGGNPNSDTGLDLRSPEAAPTSSRLPVRPGSPDISATAISRAGDASASDTSNDAANLPSDTMMNVIGPAAAEPTSDVGGKPVAALPEAGATAKPDSRATEAGTAPSSLSLQTDARLSEAALALERNVPDLLEGVEVGLAEAPRAPLPTGGTPAFEGRPVDTTPDARDALATSDNRSAPAASFGVRRTAAEVAIAALRPSGLTRVAGTATSTSDIDSTGTAAGTQTPALPLAVHNDPLVRPASGRGAEPSRIGERGRTPLDASQAPTSLPTHVGASFSNAPTRDAGDAAVLGSALLAAGLLPFVTGLAPIRSTQDEHHVSTSSIAPAAPVLANGSATSAHTGAGKGLLKHVQTAYAGDSSAAEVEQPSGESV